MFSAAVFVLSTSYIAWYFQQHEIKAVYPFDATYSTPGDAGAPRMHEAAFATEDGETLVLWRAQAAADKPTVVYFSGNAGGLKERSDRFSRLIDEGFGVVALAYRGSSGSTGMPDETALISDARALVASLDAMPLVIYGESLGTAVAIRLAAEGLGDRVVLEAPFTSIPDLILSQHPTEKLDHLITQRWESHLYVSRVTQPLLVVHGDRDHLVPITMGEEIFGMAGSDDKHFLRIADKGHNGLWTDEVQKALFAFLVAE